MKKLQLSVATRATRPSSGTRLRLPPIVDPPGENNPPSEKVWIIFGATGHMGRSLVRNALSHGDKVTAVGHTQENSAESMTGWHERCFGLLCDVRIRETVASVIDETIKYWGRIDIIAKSVLNLVADIPYEGVVAAAEDQSHHDLMNQFATNFTGTLHIIQLSLPYFRKNSIAGRYLIFSSTSGALGVPGLAPYCASKYAVEGLIESMLYETDCFNIKATLVEPGYVRLDDTDSNSVSVTLATPATPGDAALATPLLDQSETTRSTTPKEQLKRYGHFVIKPNPSPPYNTPTSPAGHAKRIFVWFDQRQPTSSVRSAELVWQLGHCSYPPLRLLLGSYAVESIRDRLRSVIEEIEDWKWLSFPLEGEEADKEDRHGVGRARSQRSRAKSDVTSDAGDDSRDGHLDRDHDEHDEDEDGEAQDDMEED